MWRMHTCYDEAKRSNQFVFPDLFSMSMPTWKRIVIIFIPCPNNSPQHKFKYHQLHMKLYGMCLVVQVLRVKEVTTSQKQCFLFVTADMAEDFFSGRCQCRNIPMHNLVNRSIHQVVHHVWCELLMTSSDGCSNQCSTRSRFLFLCNIWLNVVNFQNLILIMIALMCVLLPSYGLTKK